MLQCTSLQTFIALTFIIGNSLALCYKNQAKVVKILKKELDERFWNVFNIEFFLYCVLNRECPLSEVSLYMYTYVYVHV